MTAEHQIKDLFEEFNFLNDARFPNLKLRLVRRHQVSYMTPSNRIVHFDEYDDEAKVIQAIKRLKRSGRRAWISRVRHVAMIANSGMQPPRQHTIHCHPGYGIHVISNDKTRSYRRIKRAFRGFMAKRPAEVLLTQNIDQLTVNHPIEKTDAFPRATGPNESTKMNEDPLGGFKATRIFRVGPDGSESEAKSMPSWLRNVPKLDFRREEPGYTGKGNLRFWSCRPLAKPGRFGRTYEMVYCVDWRAAYPKTVAIGYGGSKELIIELETKDQALKLYSSLKPTKTIEAQ